MTILEGRNRLYAVLISALVLAAVLAAGAAMAQSHNPRGVGAETYSGSGKQGAPLTGTPSPTDTPAGTSTSTPTTTPLPCDVVINGAIASTDSQQTGRLRRSGIISTCDAPTSCPGTIISGSVSYDAYTFTNTSSSAACITVRLDTTGCGENHDIFSAAYLSSYDPANLCANYLADIGGTPPDNRAYSFTVPAGARFVVVVNEVYTGVGCPLYNLRISGLPCQTGTPIPTETPCPMNFSDVHPTDYFYQPVQYLYCHQAISGYSDNTFRPYNNTTRGQLSKIVVLAEGWNIDTTGGPHFTDVPTSNPFYSYIETAYNHHIISGYSDNTFRWGNNVTRAQLCKIVVGAEGWALAPPLTPTFTDVPTDHPFYAYVETAHSHGVISGYADNTFRPGNNATRGQISKIVFLAVTGP